MSIKIEHVSYTYEAGSAWERKALQDVSLEIPDGEFAGLIGHTGSGKSTLIQMMNGLTRPDSGRVYYRGEDIFGEGFSRRALRGKVGLVFQYPEYQLFETTVLRDAAFGPGNLGLSEEERVQAAKRALLQAGVPEECWEMAPFDLSGGMKRRAAIAGVLAMNPEVLILDEPTAGLDPLGRREFFELLDRLHGETGMTVLLVSHSMEDMAEHVRRMIVLDQGRILYDGTPREVFSHIRELEAISLAVPQITYLMRELQEAGCPVDGCATTLAEAKEQILRMFSGK